MNKLLTKQTFRYKLWQVLLLSVLFSFVFMIIKIVVGAVVYGGVDFLGASAAPQLAKLLSLSVAGALTLTVTVSYMRLLYSLNFMRLNAVAYKVMLWLTVFFYSNVLSTFSTVFVLPDSDDGFMIFLLPFVFFQAIIGLPFIGLVGKLFSRDSAAQDIADK